jgi:hypothetical protein
MIDSSLLLPVQTLLVHIGPHKTGTTALQSAFHAARPKLEEQGVLYAGVDRQPLRAVSALIGKAQRRGEPAPSMFNWDRLAGEIQDADEPRVVLSCESFADGDETIPAVLTDTFRDRQLHIVVTLRPLTKIVPSAWQQYVQNGLTTTYPRWLEQVFDSPDLGRSQRFWQRHDHGALIERWLTAVDAAHLTVVVADETNRGMLPRTFEAMLGLSTGTLVPEPGLQNRSLSYGEVELHRRLNVAFAEQGWGEVEYAKLLRHGMVANLQRTYKPAKNVARLRTPTWALERAAERGAATATKIRDLGVNVVGDLDVLSAAATAAETDDGSEPAITIPMRAVTQAVVGVIIGSRTLAPIEELQARQNTLPRRIKRRLRSLLGRPSPPLVQTELD